MDGIPLQDLKPSSSPVPEWRDLITMGHPLVGQIATSLIWDSRVVTPPRCT